MNNRLRNETTQETPVSAQGAVTINVIARELGVSKTTISRAISGKGRIGSETREKVLSYIQERGYQPNLIAKSLAVSRTFNIAVVLPTDTEFDEIPFFQACLHSITDEVTTRDYDVVVSIATGDDISGLRRIIRNQKVDGVILTRLVADDKAVAFLRETDVPFVVIGSSADGSLVQVDTDHYAGCREVTKHVLAANYRDVVLLAGNRDHQVNKDRFDGFSAALAAAGKRVDYGAVFWDMTSRARIESVLPALMERKADCLVCMDDVICGRVLACLQRNGLSVPGDVSVVSFHDSPVMELHNPPITALHVNVRELGATAGRIILDLIDGKDVARRNRVGYGFLVRESSRAQ
jgi:DNA-binding LacI/PurR family transcriptional regulator